MTQRKDWWWLSPESEQFLSNGYLPEGETPRSRFWKIAMTAEELSPTPDNERVKLSDKFYNYLARGYYSLASPIVSNFGRAYGLPISCNGSFTEDSIEGIMTTVSETAMMTKYGAGTSTYLGAIRPRGSSFKGEGKADGPVHFAKLFDNVIDVVAQGAVRRGACAVYLDVDHPDVLEFLRIRDIGDPIQSLSFGVCISDEWMEAVLAGDSEKRKVWAAILRRRSESGYPYLFFSDNANNFAPEVYQDPAYRIWASNLCSEIMLPANETSSFVCDLSSLNAVMYDEWRHTDAVEVLVWFLDAVMTEYINKTRGVYGFERANRFAREHRAIGIGVLGWHSLLQSKMLSFESEEALELNKKLFKTIQERSLQASEALGAHLGAPEVLRSQGIQRRNTTTTAVAPTTSSSIIFGKVSQSIEPFASNYFVKNAAKGNYTFRNEGLARLLETKGRNDEATWKAILQAGGSVQKLDFLSDEEKAVFKTFGEIAPIAIVQQAADRQHFIDQGQSLNLMLSPEIAPKEISQLLIHAWGLGLKSVYYQRSANPAQELARNILECESCSA